MPVAVQVEAVVPVLQTVDGMKSVFRAVLQDANLYWEVRVTLTDGTIHSRKHYNCPYLEVFGAMPYPDLVRAWDFEKAMFDKALEIDALPAGEEKTNRTKLMIPDIVMQEIV